MVQAPPAGTGTAGTAGEGPFLTVREVAARLRLSTATVYRICSAGELSHVRVSNTIRVPESGLCDYFRHRGQGRPQ